MWVLSSLAARHASLHNGYPGVVGDGVQLHLRPAGALMGALQSALAIVRVARRGEVIVCSFRSLPY